MKTEDISILRYRSPLRPIISILPPKADRYLDRSLDSKAYWDHQAATYDAIYNSQWSLAENNRVVSLLRSLNLPVKPTILDLGCGTGLGLRLLGEAGIEPHYFGIDISENMLKNFDKGEASPLSITLQRCDIGSLESLSIPSPDLILSTFGSLNFAEERWTTIKNMTELQAIGSKIMVMLLNQWSLRRLIKGNCFATGRYQTRSTQDNIDVLAYFDSVKGASNSLIESGYKISHVSGGGPFAGVLELDSLWQLNEKIGDCTTLMSHMITLIGERK